jgi:hypothetical protein
MEVPQINMPARDGHPSRKQPFQQIPQLKPQRASPCSSPLQNSMQLDPHFKLPKMRYKGDTPLPQFIRQDPAQQAQQAKQLISEVEDDSPAFPLLAGGSKRPTQRKAEGSRDSSSPSAAAGAVAAPAIPPATAAPSSSAAGAAGATAAGAAKSRPPKTLGSAAEPQSGVHGTAAVAGAAAQQAQQAQQQHQLQYSVEYMGRPVEAVQLTVQLPAQAAASLRAGAGAGGQLQVQGMPPGGRREASSGSSGSSSSSNSGNSVKVEVAGQSVHVEVPGCQVLEVELPFAVAAQGAGAELAPGFGQLRVRLPFRPFKYLYNEVGGEGAQIR